MKSSGPLAPRALLAKVFHQPLAPRPLRGPEAETPLTVSARLVDDLMANLGWLRADFDVRWKALCDDGVHQ